MKSKNNLKSDGSLIYINASKKTLEEIIEFVESEMILNLLERHAYCISKVAKDLGLTRRGLYMKIERYKIRLENSNSDTFLVKENVPYHSVKLNTNDDYIVLGNSPLTEEHLLIVKKLLSEVEN